MALKRLRTTALATGAVASVILSLAVSAAGPSSAAPRVGPRGLLAHPHHQAAGNGAARTLEDTDEGNDESEEIMDRAE